MGKQTSNSLILIFSLYCAAALTLLPFVSFSQEEEAGEPPLDITRIADYDIQVSLDPKTHALTGSQTINWVNPANEPTDELHFHLYMNAFRSGDTTFFEHNSGWEEESAGWIDISRMEINDGTDLLPAATIDETVMRVRLPAPVEPGGRIAIEMDFSVQLPEIFARSGFSDAYHMVAQWYPKLGVFSDEGWFCPQYKSFTEFYSNFGYYRVEITVPKNYEVEATGIRQRARTEPDTKTLVYVANPVHDFAWAASPHFRKDKRVLDYQTAEGIKKLEVHLMVQRERQHLADEYYTAIQRSLDYLGTHIGEYPYPVLKIIDPAPGRGMASAAMEYPMLIVGGVSWLDTVLYGNDHELVLVTAHEIAHQYFHSAIATNEVLEPWMDEGLSYFAEGQIITQYTPASARKDFLPIVLEELMTLSPYGAPVSAPFARLTGLLELGMERNALTRERAGYLPHADSAVIGVPAYQHAVSHDYYASAYYKPALMFRTLERMMGGENFATFLQTYYQQYKFTHPSGSQLRKLISQAAGEDLEWFFSQVIDGSGQLDYQVSELEAQAVRIDRNGQVKVPQTVQLTMEDGTTLDFHWPQIRSVGGKLWMDSYRQHPRAAGISYRLRSGGDDSWLKVELQGGASITTAQVDPDYIYLLDTNLANNSMTLTQNPALADTASIKWIRILGRWLHGYSVYN